MSGSDIPDRARFNPDDDMSEEAFLEALEEYYKAVVRNSRELSQKLKEAEARREELAERVDRLSRENEKLKQPSNYIATVEEVIEDENSIILEQHGNNQEVLADYPSSVDLSEGDRVAIDDTFSVQSVIDTGGKDARAQAMEVDTSPDVTYDGIGGLEKELQELREAVEQPLKDSGAFEKIGIEPPSGVLLHGPPGTGKTLMVKAVANSTDATFIKLAGSELVRKFIGEGSRLVRDLFEVAEENDPAIIFIDEIDAIASRRTDSKTSGDAEVQRTMMQLLSEMDGFDNRGDIRIVAATNRFDMLDDAILRPGRFDRIVEVGPPDAEGRRAIFEIHTRNMNISDDVSYEALAERTDGFTGADIRATCTEAGMEAIRDDRTLVEQGDFDAAIAKVEDDDSGTEFATDYYR